MRLSPGIIAAFATVYLVWGSTYLAIRYAVESIPPFMLGGVRFALAGAILFLYTKFTGAPRSTWIHWRNATIVGGLLLLGGNGLVNYAEKTVPSGLAALIVGSVPIWMALFDWIFFRGNRPTAIVWIGLAVGMIGIIVLIDPRQFQGLDANMLGMIAVLAACMCWSFGSLLSRKIALPSSPLHATAMEMLGGGALLLIVATARAEWSGFELAHVHLSAWIAFLYLVIFGSLLAFSTYIWLLHHATPAAVSTYAYVNPVVAVFLGWLIAGERLGANTLLAAAMIVVAVVLITMRPSFRRSPETSAPEPTAPLCAEQP